MRRSRIETFGRKRLAALARRNVSAPERLCLVVARFTVPAGSRIPVVFPGAVLPFLFYCTSTLRSPHNFPGRHIRRVANLAKRSRLEYRLRPAGTGIAEVFRAR